MKLVNQDTGELLAGKVRKAYTFMQRLRGLMFTKELPTGEALHLQPCRRVHTFGMQYAIDVLYLDTQHRIVAIDRELPPGKAGQGYPGVASVVELPSGWLHRTQTSVGQAVQFMSVNQQTKGSDDL